MLDVRSRYARGVVKRSRYAHGAVLVRSRYARGVVLVRSMYARGAVLLRSRYARGALPVRCGMLTFQWTILYINMHVHFTVFKH